MVGFHIKNSRDSFIKIEVLRAEGKAEVTLEVLISCSAPGHNASSTGFLDLGPLIRFYSELEELYKTLRGTATLRSLYEDWLNIVISARPLGHLDVRMTIEHYDEFSSGIVFGLKTDQSYLPGVLKDLKQMLNSYESP